MVSSRPKRPYRAGLSSRVTLGITLAGLLLASAVGVGAVAVQQDENDVRGRALEAAAVVTERVDIRGGYNVRVRFTTATGREVVALLADFPRDPGLRPGEALHVRYDPERPDRTLWDAREPLDFSGSRNAMAGLSAVLAIAAITFFAYVRLRQP
ncbi:DUF3592 domain-containing protein [Amycolatopsis mediterranei]|uniref:DUF3592 domain-containing protein n=1 Tax=Amycolatopsis mediterranei TaxID=33910 RepID=UPI003413B447